MEQVKKNDPYKLDAAESVFFKRELEYVKSKSYDVKHKALKAFTLIPISQEADNGATEITYESYDKIGFAKVIADYATDFPRVDVYGTQNTVKIKGLGASYGYSIKEIRSARRAGKNLNARRIETARRAVEQKMNNIAWSGDSDYNIQGLIDYPGITEYTVPADGTASSKLWSAKTPDQIVRDVTGLVSAVIAPTNGLEEPDTLLLPIEQYEYIANARMTDGNDKTIMTYILENNPHISRIEWLNELDGAGVGGTDRMMVYPMDERNLTFEIPQMFEMFDADKEGMTYKVPCHAETAGVIVYYPASIAYGDGI